MIGLYVFFGLLLNAAFFQVLPKTLRSLGNWLNHLREHFIFGAVSPAIVVSQSPPLVAVATDLRKWSQSYPVIKILEQPLHRLPGGVPPVGKRLAAVSLYYEGDAQLPHWADFAPIVVNCAIDNQTEIDRVFRSLRSEDWQDLRDGLSHVRRHDQPGLYFVDTVERYVLPEEAEREEDFAPIGQLEFLDVRDVLRVDYQLGNVLRLHRGFPSARSAWDYAKVAPGRNINNVSGTIAILIASVAMPKLSEQIFALFPNVVNAPPLLSIVLVLLLLSVVGIPILIICQVAYFMTKPFIEAWEFDRSSGTLTVRNRSVLWGARSVLYPLGQFQNIEILDENKSNSIVEYSLALRQVRRRGLLWFKPKVKHLLLAKIANSEHPELNQRLEVARQVRFTVRRFMDWLIM